MFKKNTENKDENERKTRRKMRIGKERQKKDGCDRKRKEEEKKKRKKGSRKRQ